MSGDTNREHRRITFSLDDKLTASAYHRKRPKKPLLVYVINISENGLSLVIARKWAKKFRRGDRVVLKVIQMPQPLGVINYAEVEVKHILADDSLGYATLGCEFIDIREDDRVRIRGFVNYMLIEVGTGTFRVQSIDTD